MNPTEKITGIPSRLGNYEVVEHLASGGMAEIYLAEQLGPHGFRKCVVIKRIKSDHSGDPNFESMFLDEARLSSQLSHPNIVQTYELDHAGDQWFVAMEYVDGPSFEDVVERAAVAGEAVDPSITIRVVLDVLAALVYAHDFVDHQGHHLAIVHRDVTPSNILVTTAGVAKLADFGIAKAAGRQTETQTGAVKGKYGYMAPEQIDGSGVDARTDLFAVGIVLYEALCGEKPFGDGLKAVHGVIQEDPPSLGEKNPDLPAELCDVVHRALEKDRDERFGSAAQMLEALELVARKHGVLGTTTDVVKGLALQSSSSPVADAHAPTVATDDIVAERIAKEDEAEEKPRHRWLPAMAVVLALGFFGVTAVVAAIASGGGGAYPTVVVPDMGAVQHGGESDGGRASSSKNQEERDREAARKLEERRREEQKRREDLRKKAKKRERELRKRLKEEAKERRKGGGRGKGKFQ